MEAWFLSDWHNSFSKAYKDEFTTAQNEYFQVRFRKYINDVILTRHYKDCIEEYGFFEHEYKKLSEQIQSALDEIDFLDNHMPQSIHPTVHYSKRIQGEAMLEQIDPVKVLGHCTFFFKDGFLALQAIKETEKV